MKKKEILKKILGQEVVCGGILWTRGALYAQLLSEGQPPACVDLFVMCLPTENPTPEQRTYYEQVRAALAAENGP